MICNLVKPALMSLAVLSFAAPAFAEYEAGEIAAKGGNSAEAFRQWDVSAKLGEPRSQRALGLMFERGQGVLQDYVAAHMWLNLAAAQGDKAAAKERDALARQMSAEQVADAQKRALAFKPSAVSAAGTKIDNATVAAAPVEAVAEASLETKKVDAQSAVSASSPLAGLWLDRRNGFVMSIEPSSEGGFKMREALLDDKYSFQGDVIGEFRVNEIGDGYKGRHIWGGNRQGNARWSDEGAMQVSLLDARTLQVKYIDSKYQGGWTYEKIR